MRPNTQKIYAALEVLTVAQPGKYATVFEVAMLAGVTHTAARYNLNKLVALGLVTMREEMPFVASREKRYLFRAEAQNHQNESAVKKQIRRKRRG